MICISLFTLYTSLRDHNRALLQWIHGGTSTKYVSDVDRLPVAATSSNFHKLSTVQPNHKASGTLSVKDISDVEKFVFFVGYPRSCHSIIGSMLDAHPDIIIAHELFLFQMFKYPKVSKNLKQRYNLFSMLYRNSYTEAAQGARTAEQDAKGYNLELKNSWQGRFRRLRVIGNKEGSDAVKVFRTSPKLFRKYYKQLLKTVRVPVQVFHVVRNPYDMIATKVLYRANKILTNKHPNIKLPASATKKYDNETLLSEKAKYMFDSARAIVEMVREFSMTVSELHIEDLIVDPKGTIQHICDFLEVECSVDYLQQCSDKTFKSISRTRDFIIWPQKAIARVEEEKKMYTFFQRYTFHED